MLLGAEGRFARLASTLARNETRSPRCRNQFTPMSACLSSMWALVWVSERTNHAVHVEHEDRRTACVDARDGIVEASEFEQSLTGRGVEDPEAGEAAVVDQARARTVMKHLVPAEARIGLLRLRSTTTMDEQPWLVANLVDDEQTIADGDAGFDVSTGRPSFAYVTITSSQTKE